MHVSKFVNSPDETPLHNSGLAAKAPEEFAAVQEQSFAERQKIEQLRTLVAGYKDSLIARQAPARSELGRYNKNKKSDRAQLRPPSRQKHNASGRVLTSRTPQPQQRTFREPPARGYNPYS